MDINGQHIALAFLLALFVFIVIRNAAIERNRRRKAVADADQAERMASQKRMMQSHLKLFGNLPHTDWTNGLSRKEIEKTVGERKDKKEDKIHPGQAGFDVMNDISNPIHPLNPLNPLNPASPFNHVWEQPHISNGHENIPDTSHHNHVSPSYDHTPSVDTSSHHSIPDSSSYDSGSSYDSSSSSDSGSSSFD